MTFPFSPFQLNHAGRRAVIAGWLLTSAAFMLAFPDRAAAQSRSGTLLSPAADPFRGGVPDPAPTAGAVTIPIADAIRRALAHNLGVRLAEDAVSQAQSNRATARAALLPDVNGSISETRRKTNLEAFGFPLGPTFPRVVGPFNVFDARVFASQSLLDLVAINDARAETHLVSAARYSFRGARETVVLVAANLYLQTLAASARADSARAQVDTAQALYAQAQDLRQSGIVAGLDVVRAETRLMGDRQRAIVAANDYEKMKLQLARVMGLAIGQEFVLTNDVPEVPVPDMTLDEALTRAYRDRPDYLAAQERVKAAESARRAASAEYLPSVHLTADYGTIGLQVSSALPTFSVAGAVDVPLFRGGRTQARVSEADAQLRTRKAEAEDLRAGIYNDVRSAFLDLRAGEAELAAATRGRELADLQLTQSRDRFAAGVADNVEVIQAQEAVARAAEQYIAAQYDYSVAKALLARSLGAGEDAVEKYLGGLP